MDRDELLDDLPEGTTVFFESHALELIREQAAISGVLLDYPFTEATAIAVREVLDRDDLYKRSAVLGRLGAYERDISVTTARTFAADAEALAAAFLRSRIRSRAAKARFPGAVVLRSKAP